MGSIRPVKVNIFNQYLTKYMSILIVLLIACKCNTMGVVDGAFTCDKNGNCGKCDAGYAPGFPRRCNTCSSGYFVSAGTNGINPTCTGESFNIF